MILAVGNSRDYEIAALNIVASTLRERGEVVVLFRQDRCLNGEYLVFEIGDDSASFSVVIDDIVYDTRDFSSVWYLHPHLPGELLRFEPPEYRHFIDKQFQEMRRALYSILASAVWVNDPWSTIKAENKIFQLNQAIGTGFRVPRTLVTSDPGRVKTFHRKVGGNMVVKILGVCPLVGKVVYTSLVTSEYLDQIESVKLSPSIFQERVQKSYELRITVVGDKIFTAKIYSQEDTATALDWRARPLINDFTVKMEKATIPAEIESMIRSFMSKMGLRYGCIDMIVTPSGEYVFLEVNPSGQWYFVQLRTEMQVGESIADLLQNA